MKHHTFPSGPAAAGAIPHLTPPALMLTPALSFALTLSLCNGVSAQAHAEPQPPALSSATAEPTSTTATAASPAFAAANEVVEIRAGRPSSLPTRIPTTIEGISRETLERSINATDAEDALKYFPSLLVRKRYIGDYDHAVLSSRASGTGNSARSLVYADGILLSNLLGNGFSFTPRWGLVTPEEIDRVDVLYGPFSAAYPGNAVGAVVDYVTRMPERLEAHVKLGAFSQRFKLYGTDDRFSGGQASASLGSRSGDWSWWVDVSRLDSDGQPLVYATRTPSTPAPAAGAIPVTGAVLEKNRFNQDWLLLGTSSQAHTRQDHAKLKLAWQATPTLRGSYTLGWWGNEVQRSSQTWLRDASGERIAFGPQSFPASGSLPIAIDGRGYTLGAADLPQTREQLQHLMHGLSLKSTTRGIWDWEATASRYDYERDRVRAWAPRAATTAAPADADSGRITDQAGTGWDTLALKGIWRPQGEGGEHIAEFGVQRDSFRLRTRVYGSDEWMGGAPVGDPTSRFEGDTRLTSLWAQDAWRFAPDWNAVAGLRLEDWRASNGLTATAASRFEHPTRSRTQASPKLAIGYQASDALALRLATGRAVRLPTVSELYQGAVDASGNLQNGNAALKPERSWTTELSAEVVWPKAQWRATLFHEDTRDALYSQTNTTITPNVTNIQNVDRIRTVGLELAASARDLWLAGLDLSGSLTYTDSVIVANAAFPASEGRLQPRVPRWRGNLVATWRASEALSSTLGLRFAQHQFGTLDNTDPNGARYQGISDFVVADLRVRYRFDRQWSAAVGVDNLNNRVFWNFHPYPQRTAIAELKFDL